MARDPISMRKVLCPTDYSWTPYEKSHIGLKTEMSLFQHIYT